MLINQENSTNLIAQEPDTKFERNLNQLIINAARTCRNWTAWTVLVGAEDDSIAFELSQVVPQWT